MSAQHTAHAEEVLMHASLTGHQAHEQPVPALSAAALCAPAVPPVTCDSRCVVCRIWAHLTYYQDAGLGVTWQRAFMCPSGVASPEMVRM